MKTAVTTLGFLLLAGVGSALLPRSLWAATEVRLDRTSAPPDAGYEQLDAFLEKMESSPRDGAATVLNKLGNDEANRRKLDELCNQKDCFASLLYWHTDLPSAQAEARRSSKPILMLRLLGRLDAERSCANSRFFRSILYPNREIRKYLRERYVLVWTSEREVPLVTVDFADGRRIETTLTGNSIHFVLNSDLKVLDALPGLYAPQHFLSFLRDGYYLYYRSRSAASPARFVQQFQRGRLMRAERRWREALDTYFKEGKGRSPSFNGLPPQIVSADRTVSKDAVEARLRTSTLLPPPRAPRPARPRIFVSLMTETPADFWEWLANTDLRSNRWGNNESQFVMWKVGASVRNFKALPRFKRLVALDSVKNEFILRTQITEVLSRHALVLDWDTLNRFVYDELFTTEVNDPWMGLSPEDSYAALPANGKIQKGDR